MCMLAEWLKNIVVCSILFSVVLYIAPDPKMRRYVQAAVGFVMMMVVINPVIGWLGYADRIEFNTYSESLGMDVAEGDDEMYVRAMEEVVERFISDNCNADAVVRIVTREELGIDSMEIYIQFDKVDTDGLRSAVSEEYGVDENRITIRRGNTDHMQEGL